MAGRGIARIDRGGNGTGPRLAYSMLSSRAVRLGPPANDNSPALRVVLRLVVVTLVLLAAMSFAAAMLL